MIDVATVILLDVPVELMSDFGEVVSSTCAVGDVDLAKKDPDVRAT